MNIRERARCTDCGREAGAGSSVPKDNQGWRYFRPGGLHVCADCYRNGPPASKPSQSVYGGPHVCSAKGIIVTTPFYDPPQMRHV